MNIFYSSATFVKENLLFPKVLQFQAGDISARGKKKFSLELNPTTIPTVKTGYEIGYFMFIHFLISCITFLYHNETVDKLFLIFKLLIAGKCILANFAYVKMINS